MAEDAPFLRRWSRRKVQAREEEAAPVVVTPEITDAPPPAEVENTVSEVEPVNETDATAAQIDPNDLPDIDSLNAESDFSAFMQNGVPEELQQLALRKLWRLDPVLANVDGLVDYGEDFTDAATVIANMKSSYQVGKGYVTETEAETTESEEEEIDTAEADQADDSLADPLETAEAPEDNNGNDDGKPETGEEPQDIEAVVAEQGEKSVT